MVPLTREHRAIHRNGAGCHASQPALRHNLSMRSILLFSATTLLAFAPLAQAQDSAKPKRALALDDMHKFLQVGDPQCSPDGKWVAYTVSTTDVTADKRDTDVWMVSWDG